MFLIALFHCWFLSYPMAFSIAFSKKLLEKSFFLKEQYLEQIVSWPNVFSIIQNWPPKTFQYVFFSKPGPKYTPSCNHLNTSEKVIITSSVTKDVYIRPCISLFFSSFFLNQYPYFGNILINCKDVQSPEIFHFET